MTASRKSFVLNDLITIDDELYIHDNDDLENEFVGPARATNRVMARPRSWCRNGSTRC